MRSPDLYESVTARIIAALERGTPPWCRPWSQDVDLPMNAETRRPYHGINALLLSMEATSQGYALNRWLTYRQAEELGAQVRRGERGTAVVLCRLRKVSARAEVYPTPDEPDLDERVIPLLRAFTVFNVSQVDGVPDALRTVLRHDWAPLERAEELLVRSGASIHHGGAQAFYSPAHDEIQLPPRHLFPAADRFYATALHELSHWTGHPSRCNRQLSTRFGDAAYAVEELIAEMAAAFLCAHCRIDGALQHAAYLQSWLDLLGADKRAIFVAATRAQQAADYLLTLVPPANAEALAA